MVLVCAAGAQTASITGTVADSTGAVVQGAEITIQNTETGAVRTVTSGGTGLYSATNLPVGKYQLEVRKQNFATVRLSDITLSVDQVLTANVSLKPGSASEEVSVNAASLPPVDLESAQVSNVVDARQMQDLPLIVRDPYSLVLLSPGTAQTNALGGFTVNGSRERNNNFLLDGVDNNDTSVPGIPDGVLGANPDSTEEFRVITNNFNAEYGRNTGAIIDVVTKSGTNTFHGGVYEFGRWNGFGGARDWFNQAPNPMNPYVRNQFGYSFGGPIRKNKTFFFFNEEFDRFRTTLTNSVVAPTAGFKAGKFNYTAVNPSTGVVETDPVDLTQTGANNAFGAPLDPTMQNVLALFPTPTQSADGLTGTVFFPSGSAQNSYNTVAKIDHRITDRESLSLRYGYDHFFDPNPFHADILPGNVGGINTKSINQGLSANLTSNFRPNLINSFVFGWNKVYATFGCTGISTLDSVVPQLDRFNNGWDFFMDPFTSIGCTALVSDGQFRKTGTTSYSDYVSWVHGKHTLKFGGDFRNVGEQGANSFFSRREPTMQFGFPNTGFSLIANAPANDSISLEDSAYALYGFVWEDFAGEYFNKAAVRQGSDGKHFRQHEYDWFGQDAWKVRPNLTLTLGLRYQLDGVPYEEGANFSNLLADPGSFQAGQPVVMSVVGPGTGKSLYKQDYSNIEPRIGFSWDPYKDGKTAIRGAFGIFHDRVFGNLFGNARGNPPFEQDYLTFPFETINNAFGSGAFPLVVPDTTPSATIPDGSALGPVLFDVHFRNSASNNWNFGIQHELPGNNTIDLSYVASEGHHIYRQRDGNPPDPTLVAQLVAYCSVPNSFNCTPATVSSTNLYLGKEFGTLPFNAVNNNALFQPFYQISAGNSIYNSLQAKVTHRLSHGLQVQGSYTWAHAIDNSSDPLAPAQGNRTFPRNSRSLNQDRGNSDNDVRHIGVINYLWEVPLGRGKGYLNTGGLGRIFEGMQLSGITTAQTGFPFEIRCPLDTQRTGIAAWCDQVGDPFAQGSNSQPGFKTYFPNTTAFAIPNFGGPGNIGRNHFYGPGYVNFDMDFSKKTKLTERVDLEFRFECYNIFNHPHFQQPDNALTDSTFGLISATVARPDATTSARQMQVALKLNF
jgi:Carboxypeptidase regulatory-like domain